MKYFNIVKIISCISIFISISMFNTVGVSAEWILAKHDAGDLWRYSEGNSYATGWEKIDDKWYHFDEYGNMDSGCYVENYYLNTQGAWMHLEYATNSKFNEFLKRLNEIEKNDSKESKKAYTSCTTWDILMYSDKFNKQYDELLNDIYKYLKSNMSKSKFTKLQNEEIDWINKKETAIKSSEKEVEGGSMATYVGLLTSLGYTHERIYYLLKYIN